MEYLSLNRGHLASIMIPLVLIFNKMIDFQAIYFKRKYEKKIIIFGCCIAFIGGGVFYYNNYSKYFCFIWLGLFTIVLYTQILFNRRIYKKTHKFSDSFNYLNGIDKFYSYLSIGFGIICIVFPFTPIHINVSGGNNEFKTVVVSKIIFVLMGLFYVVLNKVFIYICKNKLIKFKVMI